MNLRNSRPIPNKSVYEFVVSEIKNTNLYDLDKIPEFCENYSNWIQSTKLNNLIGLENFKSKQYVHGTCQSFDFFYLSHPYFLYLSHLYFLYLSHSQMLSLLP